MNVFMGHVPGKTVLLSCTESKSTNMDYEYTGAGARSVHVQTPRVMDQGQTGACVGFAIAGAMSLIKAQLFNPYFIWKASKELDEFRSGPTTFIQLEGTSIKAGLDVVRKYGAIPVSSTDNLLTEYNGSYSEFIRQAASNRISFYEAVASGNLVSALEHGPVVGRINPDQNFMIGQAVLTDYKAAIAARLHAAHAVCIVSSRIVGNKREYKIMNSWGTDWGDNGCCWISHDYLIRAFSELYRIQF